MLKRYRFAKEIVGLAPMEIVARIAAKRRNDMKYCSINQLNDFEFHDANFTIVKFDGDELIVSARHLNIHKETEQNPYECDMEIDRARIAFKGFRAYSFEPGRTWKPDWNGELKTNEPRIVFDGREAEKKIIQTLEVGVWINGFEKEDDSRYCFDGCTLEPNSTYFAAEFSFDCVTVEWDRYRKGAWYERNEHYETEITLSTLNDDRIINAQMFEYEEVYKTADEKLDKMRSVNIGIVYDGEELWGRGNDHRWEDAFADLQRQLPTGVIIKCCLTCRHGNMCPVGNEQGEVFCTKDVTITEKSDLFFYTEDKIEREKRSRCSTFVCEDYQPQSDEHYTYNDFLYYLKKTE